MGICYTSYAHTKSKIGENKRITKRSEVRGGRKGCVLAGLRKLGVLHDKRNSQRYYLDSG
jgi:hypothetical protein